MLSRMDLRSTLLRPSVLAAVSCVLLAVGCDEPAAPPTPPASPATSPAGTGSPAATSAAATKSRISLGAIPLSIEAPAGWDLKPGVTGKIVLRGRSPSGELDVLLGTGPSIKGDALPLMLKESAKPSNDRHVKTEITQRDGMTLIQSYAPQLPPGTTPSSDPELVPMGWSVQCIVSDGKLDYSVYELTIMGLSQGMFDRDEKFIRDMIDTLRFEGSTTQPATR